MMRSMSMAAKFAKNASSLKRSSPMCTVASKTIQLTFVDVEVRSKSLIAHHLYLQWNSWPKIYTITYFDCRVIVQLFQPALDNHYYM